MGAQNPKKLTHLAYAVGGLALGHLWAKSQASNAMKSRAERDFPDETREVVEEIGELMDAWEPAQGCESEGDFTNDLADYLDEHCDWEIEVCPGTREGNPDILIGDLLALELKVNPGRNERNRLVGQCAGYSRSWPTWAILIDSPASAVGDLEDLLADKGLDHILVWAFGED